MRDHRHGGRSSSSESDVLVGPLLGQCVEADRPPPRVLSEAFLRKMGKSLHTLPPKRDYDDTFRW